MNESGAAVRNRQSIRRWENLPAPMRKVAVRSRRWAHLSRPAHPRVTVERRGDIALITFDDGKVNVISRKSTPMLVDAYERVASDDRVKAAVLAGRQGQFSAGFDLDTMMIGGADRDELFRGAWTMLRHYFLLPIPLVVACTGHAIAAGAALLLAGDVRLGAQGEHKIGFNEAAIGLPLPGLLLLLARERLTAEAYEPATAGARLYSPDEAHAAGFVDRVLPADQVVDAAVAEAHRLAAGTDVLAATSKRATVAERTERIDAQLATDLDLLTHLGRRRSSA